MNNLIVMSINLIKQFKDVLIKNIKKQQDIEDNNYFDYVPNNDLNYLNLTFTFPLILAYGEPHATRLSFPTLSRP